MYQRLHMWDEALNLAEAKAHPDLEELRVAHARWLLDTGQEEKAGSLNEAKGDYLGALNMYLKAGLATRASRLLQSHQDDLMSNPDIVGRVTNALLKGEFYEQAGKDCYSGIYQNIKANEIISFEI